VITEIRKRYHCKVGFSDHTLGYAASLAAAALGATVIEKHFTFSRCMYGSDAKHSMEPDAFSKFCSEIQDAWSMLKNPIEKNDTNPYREMKKIFQKSIVASCDIPEGTRIEMKHLAFKKSGDGLTVSSFRDILGKKTSRELKKNDRITFNDLS
jgi:N-acetylneuraminate synthase